MITLAAVLLLAPAAPAQAAAQSDDRATRCFRDEVHGGTKVRAYIGDRACIDLSAPRAYDGVWLNNFEGSRFVEGATSLDEALRDRGSIWLNRHDLLKPSAVPIGPYGRAYRMRFIGRAAAKSAQEPLTGYGHMGMSRDLVVVDEIQALDEIGPAAR